METTHHVQVARARAEGASSEHLHAHKRWRLQILLFLHLPQCLHHLRKLLLQLHHFLAHGPRSALGLDWGCWLVAADWCACLKTWEVEVVGGEADGLTCGAGRSFRMEDLCVEAVAKLIGHQQRICLCEAASPSRCYGCMRLGWLLAPGTCQLPCSVPAPVQGNIYTALPVRVHSQLPPTATRPPMPSRHHSR